MLNCIHRHGESSSLNVIRLIIQIEEAIHLHMFIVQVYLVLSDYFDPPAFTGCIINRSNMEP